MNKKNLKLVSVALLATLTMGTTFTGCKDYDDDLNRLQEQIDANKKAIEGLQAKINAGAVITSVSNTADGVLVTLSDGKTFTLTNGKDGTSAVVWTIGTDGYWYKDGAKTDYKAVGQDGAQGPQGEPGAAGAPGADGAYFEPNADGFFYKVTKDADGNDVKEKTEIAWKATAGSEGALSAAMSGSNLLLSGVEGSDDVVVIPLTTSLQGLVFQPDYTLFGGEPVILYSVFEYQDLGVKSQDSKTELWEPKKQDVYNTINTGSKLNYKVTPSNTKESDLKDLSYDMITAIDLFRSTAAIDVDFVSYANSILTVNAKFSDEFTQALVENMDSDNRRERVITQLALQAAINDGKDTITSTQYVTVMPSDYSEFYIAKPAKDEDYHYRTLINAEQPWAGNEEKAWDGTEDSEDFTMVYGTTINLYDYVELHTDKPQQGGDPDAGCLTVKPEDYGLNYVFEVVKNYKLGEPATDQAEFVEFNPETGDLTTRVYSLDGNVASVGRTPLIRVKLMDGQKVVAVAYIKILITDKDLTPIDPIEMNVAKGFEYKCLEPSETAITVKQMNEEIYYVVGMSKAAFHAAYTLEDTDAKKNDGITAEEVQVPGDATSYVVKLTMTPDAAWNNAGKTVKHTVTYKGTNLPDVVITFVVKVADAAKTAEVKVADMLKHVWAADYSYAKLNVAVPQTPTDDDPANCTFDNDLNYPFVTENGIIKGFENINYTFAKENKANGVKFGKYTADITLSETNDTLYAQIKTVDGKAVTPNDPLGDKEIVATIENADDSNTIRYAETETAKALLNTTEMKAYIGATTTPCIDDPEKVLTVIFNGKTYFQANFICPLKVSGVAADTFVDGVDLGTKGSYIALEDLVALSDWRNLKFADNAHFYGFYGISEIGVDVANVMTTINGEPAINLSNTNTQLFVKTTAEMTAAYPTVTFDSKYGYILYSNGTATVNADYELTVPVTVSYKWGTTKEVAVTVIVKKTLGQAKKK